MRIIVRPPHIAALLAHGIATVVTWPEHPGLTLGERALFAADESTDERMTDLLGGRGGGIVDRLAGHIVGSGTVEAVVPIRRENWLPVLDAHIEIGPGNMTADYWLGDGDGSLGEHGTCIDLTDQLPFATFTPGLTAVLLADAKSTTDRCPACWGEGWTEDSPGAPDGSRSGCRHCRISSARPSVCPPIPWTGNDLDEWVP